MPVPAFKSGPEGAPTAVRGIEKNLPSQKKFKAADKKISAGQTI
jgi:hypothetical protein